jgi:carboxymethylenebutenolidase
MIVQSTDVTVMVSGKPMRVLVTEPARAGRYPGILMYSDIFQITGPQLRASRRLAGYGFVVATPEIFHRVEPAGTAIPFDDDGRTRGMAAARATKVSELDADCRATLDLLKAHAHVATNRLGAMGFCIGGHLGFRAALQPDVRAAALFYPTGVHDGKLGADADAGSLARAKEISGELLLIFGSRDPHVPEEGRRIIDTALRAAGTRFETRVFDAEHAFARDEGPRYDAEATDDAWRDAVAFLRRVLLTAPTVHGS